MSELGNRLNPPVRPTLRTIAKGSLSSAAYGRAAAFWHLRGRFTWALKLALKHGRPDTLFHFGCAPGDDLLCTAVLRELAIRDRKKVWMMSNYPELFVGNQDVDHVVAVDRQIEEYLVLRGGKYRLLEYAPHDDVIDAAAPPSQHIIAELCVRAGAKGQIALRPYFHLTPAEKERAAWADQMIAVQSSGLAGKIPMKNKQWIPGRFQHVVDLLKRDFRFVQVGSIEDPPLNEVTDLRGKTNIRETAAVLANCQLYVGNVGFLMHLARAVECPAVIVFGGREAPWQSGYSCNLNLYSAVPCAPCWLRNTCHHDHMCMEQITAVEVVHAIEKRIAARGNHLVTDYAGLPPNAFDSLADSPISI